MNKILVLLILSALMLSACGPEPEPTMSVEDIQGTAVAAAFTMIAETQAAIPTATPVPPTAIPSATPIPTNTVAPFEVPTQDIVAAEPTATAPADLCSDLRHVIPGDAAGPQTTFLIKNEHKSPATVSVYLNKTVFGECGYRSYTLTRNGSTSVTLPQGCYSAWAWSQDNKDPFNAEGYGLCANNPDKWTMVIRGDRIILLPP
ncbi:MAG: hypothetical protein WBL25_02305 [Anaerolineales bacterium]